MTVKELYHVKYTEVSKVKVWLVQNIEDLTVPSVRRGLTMVHGRGDSLISDFKGTRSLPVIDCVVSIEGGPKII